MRLTLGSVHTNGIKLNGVSWLKVNGMSGEIST